MRRIAMIADKYFPFAHMVRGADDAFLFHFFNDPRRPVISDLQVPLNKTGRRLAFRRNKRNGAVIQFITAIAAPAKFKPTLTFVIIGNGFYIGGFALRLQKPDNAFNFIVMNKRPMHPRNASAPGHVQHIALPQQLFRALFA